VESEAVAAVCEKIEQALNATAKLCGCVRIPGVV
jgi:hypothetical protein